MEKSMEAVSSASPKGTVLIDEAFHYALVKKVCTRSY